MLVTISGMYDKAYKACYYGGWWNNAVAFQCASVYRDGAQETKAFLRVSCVNPFQGNSPSSSSSSSVSLASSLNSCSCCARGTEYVLPNPPSPQCHTIILSRHIYPVAFGSPIDRTRDSFHRNRSRDPSLSSLRVKLLLRLKRVFAHTNDR